jgi:hypothetical protein
MCAIGLITQHIITPSVSKLEASSTARHMAGYTVRNLGVLLKTSEPFNPEDRCRMFLRKVAIRQQDYTVSESKKQSEHNSADSRKSGGDDSVQTQLQRNQRYVRMHVCRYLRILSQYCDI